MRNIAIDVQIANAIAFAFSPVLADTGPAPIAPTAGLIAAGDHNSPETYPAYSVATAKAAWPNVTTSQTRGAVKVPTGLTLLKPNAAGTDWERVPFQLIAAEVLNGLSIRTASIAAGLESEIGASMRGLYSNVLMNTSVSGVGLSPDLPIFPLPSAILANQDGRGVESLIKSVSTAQTDKFPYVQRTVFEPANVSFPSVTGVIASASMPTVNPWTANSMVNWAPFWDGITGTDYLWCQGSCLQHYGIAIDPGYLANERTAQTDLYIMLTLDCTGSYGLASPFGSTGPLTGTQLSTNAGAWGRNYGSFQTVVIPLASLRTTSTVKGTASIAITTADDEDKALSDSLIKSSGHYCPAGLLGEYAVSTANSPSRSLPFIDAPIGIPTGLIGPIV